MDELENKKIRHIVLFNLKYDKNNLKAKMFLTKSRELISSIADAGNFEIFNQINEENRFDFGFSMEFKDKDTYQSYEKNPAHIDYSKKYWSKEVDDFMVIDFENI